MYGQLSIVANYTNFLLFPFYLDSVWGVYGNGNGQSEAFNLKTTSPLGCSLPGRPAGS